MGRCWPVGTCAAPFWRWRIDAIDDGIYNPIWFDGPQLPDALVPDDNEAANSEENDDFLEAVSSDEAGDARDNEDDSGEGQ